MCDKLKKKIEDAKQLSRSDRRKKERELQRKYNDKNIRIMCGKTFKKSESFTKKQRRELYKNKNLLKELIKIINKYFPTLNNLGSLLTDKRHKSHVKYNMKTIIMTKLLALICGITTSIDEFK